ncbi:trigger factor [Bacteroides propionicifaciens]|jgi:trigger factor|uniref:trigger factor n=1 Tax=Bacteroides propionicifaciens TaxID=392838 RepID=UPI0003A09828|nr:trigger factor [Bacteroides propionicifaciens]
MNVSLQNIDKVSAMLTVKIEKADYQESVDNSLKKFRKQAQVPGFRKGMVPASLVKKMYGKSAIAEEVNKLLSEQIYGYIKENNLNVLGEPLPNEEKQTPIDFETMEDFEFIFDLALAPEVKAQINKDVKVDYNVINVSDEMIDSQIAAHTQRTGAYESVEEYQDKDMLKGDIAEVTEKGNIKRTGIKADEVVLMPAYMKDEEQKALFNGAKVKDNIIFNPGKAYEKNAAEISSLLKIEKDEVETLDSDFKFQISEITRFVAGPINQDLFDQVFGEGEIKSEEEFRARIKSDIEKQFTLDSNYRFLLDLKDVLMANEGDVQFPEAILKRVMLLNNEEKDESFVEENFDKSIEELKWHLIKEKLVKENDVKVEEQDVKEMAAAATRAQFAQYGMTQVPDDLLENYIGEMMKNRQTVEGLVNRVVETKLADAIKDKVTLNNKSVSIDEFNKLFEK